MYFIQWCNDNNDFLTVVLSIIGLVLSVTAIAVSIRTAKLPYKKKLLLTSSVLREFNYELNIVGLVVTAVNVGNRSITITCLGYVFKKNGMFYMVCPNFIKPNHTMQLTPSEIKEAYYSKDELVKAFSDINPRTRVIAFVRDSGL